MPRDQPDRVCRRHAPRVPVPARPVRLALIGAGSRMTNVFVPAFASARDWIEIVAVCNRRAARRNALAARLGVPGFANPASLLAAGLCEAALVVTPPAMHHPLSVYLSRRGVHHITETPWALTAWGARQMLQTAREHGVVSRTAENFVRFARDRFAELVRDSGVIGLIHRIISYGSIIGFHTSARWRRFAGQAPQWVQAVAHTAATAPHVPRPGGAPITQETYQARHLLFPDGLFVTDHCANRKGFLGRFPRDGYHEWQGERGALICTASEPTCRTRFAGGQVAECARPCPTFTPEVMTLRRCAELNDGTVRHVHDEVSEVIHEMDGCDWLRSHAHTSQGLLEYVNPLRVVQQIDNPLPEYAVSIVGELVDFALAVRGLATSEFDDQAACDTVMIEAAARESLNRRGARVALPLEANVPTDSTVDAQLRGLLGTDPHDVEAVVASSFRAEGTGAGIASMDPKARPSHQETCG